MPSLEVFIDRFIEDGRVVVTNNSLSDIALGTIFNRAFCADSKMAEVTTQNREDVAPRGISLKLKSVDVFRKQIEYVPKGFSAAVELDGQGLDIIRNLFDEAKSKNARVFLGTE